MCHFITMILPAGTDLGSTSRVFGQHHFKPVEMSDHRVLPLLQSGEIYFHPTGKICDCGTALGSLGRRPEAARTSAEIFTRLRKKGWSETKIQRWMAQQVQTAERDKRVHDARVNAVAGSDPDGWCSILRGLLCDLRLPYAGILLHWYSGGLPTEAINARGRMSVPMDDKLPDTLFRMKEDTLYIIGKHPPAFARHSEN